MYLPSQSTGWTRRACGFASSTFYIVGEHYVASTFGVPCFVNDYNRDNFVVYIYITTFDVRGFVNGKYAKYRNRDNWYLIETF